MKAQVKRTWLIWAEPAWKKNLVCIAGTGQSILVPRSERSTRLTSAWTNTSNHGGAFFRHWLDLSSKSERRLRTPDMNASSPSVHSNSQANLKGTRRHQRLWALGICKCLAFLLEGTWRYAAQLRQKAKPFIESPLEGGIPTRSSSFHHKNKCYFVHRHFKRWRRVVGTPPGMFCQRLSAVTYASDIIAPFFVTTRHPQDIGTLPGCQGDGQGAEDVMEGRPGRAGWWKHSAVDPVNSHCSQVTNMAHKNPQPRCLLVTMFITV